MLALNGRPVRLRRPGKSIQNVRENNGARQTNENTVEMSLGDFCRYCRSFSAAKRVTCAYTLPWPTPEGDDSVQFSFRDETFTYFGTLIVTKYDVKIKYIRSSHYPAAGYFLTSYGTQRL